MSLNCKYLLNPSNLWILNFLKDLGFVAFAEQTMEIFVLSPFSTVIKSHFYVMSSFILNINISAEFTMH